MLCYWPLTRCVTRNCTILWWHFAFLSIDVSNLDVRPVKNEDGNFVFILNRPPESIDVDSILPGFILEPLPLPLGKVDSGIVLKWGDDGVSKLSE